MPTVTIYIRNEDLVSWLTIEKKAEFIHDAILRINENASDPTFDPEINVSKLLGKSEEKINSFKEELHKFDPETHTPGVAVKKDWRAENLKSVDNVFPGAEDISAEYDYQPDPQ